MSLDPEEAFKAKLADESRSSSSSSSDDTLELTEHHLREADIAENIIKERIENILEHVALVHMKDGKIDDPLAKLLEKDAKELQEKGKKRRVQRYHGYIVNDAVDVGGTEEKEEYSCIAEKAAAANKRYKELRDKVKTIQKLQQVKHCTDEDYKKMYKTERTKAIQKYERTLAKLKEKELEELLERPRPADPSKVKTFRDNFLKDRNEKRLAIAKRHNLVRVENKLEQYMSRKITEFVTRLLIYAAYVKRAQHKTAKIKEIQGEILRIKGEIKKNKAIRKKLERSRQLKEKHIVQKQKMSGKKTKKESRKSVFDTRTLDEGMRSSVTQRDSVLPQIFKKDSKSSPGKMTGPPLVKKPLKLPPVVLHKQPPKTFPGKVTETKLGKPALIKYGESYMSLSMVRSEKSQTLSEVVTDVKSEHNRLTHSTPRQQSPFSDREDIQNYIKSLKPPKLGPMKFKSGMRRKNMRSEVSTLARQIQEQFVPKSLNMLLKEAERERLSKKPSEVKSTAKLYIVPGMTSFKTKEEQHRAFKRKLERKRAKELKKLCDKVTLTSTTLYDSPIHVSDALGGKYILEGWKIVTRSQMKKMGRQLPVQKAEWRKKDITANYKIIKMKKRKANEPKHRFLVNGLDLTPRPIDYGKFTKAPRNFRAKFRYCMKFFMNKILGSSEKSFSNYLPPDAELKPGQFRVPHLRNMVFGPPEKLDYYTLGTVNEEETEERNYSCPVEAFPIKSEIPKEEDQYPKAIRVRIQETETMFLFSYDGFIGEGDESEKSNEKIEKKRKRWWTHDKFTQIYRSNVLHRSTVMEPVTRACVGIQTCFSDIIQAFIEPPKEEADIESMRQRIGFNSDSDSSVAEEDEHSEDPNLQILTSDSFKSSHRIMLRLIDSIVYQDRELIYHNRFILSELCQNAVAAYAHKRLWTFYEPILVLSELKVTSFSWNTVNMNILAVGYARHEFHSKDRGVVCIWNIKYVSRYEKKYVFESSVTHIEFSQAYPSMLSVAMRNGSIALVDIVELTKYIKVSRTPEIFSDNMPVWQVSWFATEEGDEFPVAVGGSGCIHKFRMDLTFAHSVLLMISHVEGTIRGINFPPNLRPRPKFELRPGITCFTRHPTEKLLYLAGTSDGCVRICSLNFRNQHLDVFRAHLSYVWGIKFHPDTPHIFLTYGGDFYVRIWIYGFYEPIFSLSARMEFVFSASWSPLNPEILVSISGSFVDVWDLRRIRYRRRTQELKPSHTWVNPRNETNTELIFDQTGRNVIIGDSQGFVHVYALKCTPFHIYLKGECLARALFRSLGDNQKVINVLRKLGYPFDIEE